MSRVRIDPGSRVPLPDADLFARRPSACVTEGVESGADAIAQRGATPPSRGAAGASSAEATSRSVPPFVELFARSHFSFLAGATAPARLVAVAAARGYDAIGLADLDGFYGAVRALEESERLVKEEGLATAPRLILGCELTLDANDGESLEAVEPNEPADVDESFRRSSLPFVSVVLHVASHEGYENACRLLTESHARHPKSERRSARSATGEVGRRGVARGRAYAPDERARNTFAGLPLASVLAHAGGLYATLKPSRTLVLAVHRGGTERRDALARAMRSLEAFREAFGARASLLLTRHLDGEDRARFATVRALAAASGVPIVASNAPLFATASEKPLFDVMSCIREGRTLDAAGRALLPNAEAHLKSADEMAQLFADLPEAVARTRLLAEACRFSLRELRYRFPCELDAPAFDGETPDEALRRVTALGLARRYEGSVPSSVQTQVDRELALIQKIGVAPYFLSVQTIVEMARCRDILCQGRGSAANSAVCFALGITAVDPSRSNLLFERFLSAERAEPPDIDVDFEHERREEVIQAIYEKYGRDRAAMVSEVISYRGKSALREVGKVFGLSLEQCERLSSLVSWWDGVSAIAPERLTAAGFDGKDGRIELVLRYAAALQGAPRHLSIHVGGFVLSAEPLARVAPVEPATMEGRTIIPWDKDDLDTLGFFKVDVLGLGMLTAIRKALAFAAVTDGRVRAASAIESLAKIPAEDPAVYDALCRADTVGVFQIESRAQMAMLPRLLPRTFYDLVVEVAIVRPGPIQGGMVHPYLRRRNAEEPAVAPHPLLAPILDRTLGVPLFQEQVMQIAIVGAGYTGGEADQLRRDMAAWKKTGRLERHKGKLLEGFERRGIAREFGERLYAQVQGFGEYGFPESHAASFALLVYASSWLKVHHPAAFAAALVNSQPMGFYSPNTILKDAERHGVTLLPIDALESRWDCTLHDEPLAAPPVELRQAASFARSGDEPSPLGSRFVRPPRNVVRVGLRQVKGLGEESGRRIEAFVAARRFDEHGEPRPPGKSAELAELIDGARLSRKELEALAEAGALDSLVRRTPRGAGALSDVASSHARAVAADANRGAGDGLERRGRSVARRSLADAPAATVRREAMWAVRAPRAAQGELFEGKAFAETPHAFAPITRGEQLALDYERTGLSTLDHPMKLLRGAIPPHFVDSRSLDKARHGAPISVAGLVICRQRPGTASGVVFITMEDEHGFLNLILYARVFEEQRHVATTAHLLVAHGKVEREGRVVYVVVERLEPLRRGGRPSDRTLPSMSRDFH